MARRGPIEASIERAWREVGAVEESFARGEIDQAEWHRRMAAIIVPAYLSAENPRAQSGYSGSEADWRQARGIVADAIRRSGTFLDVGCANGLLMERVRAWCGEQGRCIEPYGVEIAPELAALARLRLPQWADRVFVGNAASWVPPFRFDFVRTGLEYVPRDGRPALIAHLLSHAVASDGRLLIGPYSEARAHRTLAEQVQSWGFIIDGRLERPHPRDDRVMRRLLYLDA